MLSTATVTMDLSDLLGVDFDARRTKVWISTNVPNDTVIDTDANKIRLGSGNVTVTADGTAAIDVWTPGAEANPSSWQTYIHVDYPDRQAHGGRGKRTFGPFTITASADLADLVDEQEVPAEYVTTLTAELDGYVTDAANHAAVAQSAASLATAVSGADTADDLIVALDADAGSDFRVAQDARLAATFAPVITPEKYGAVGDGVADDTAAVVAAFNAAEALRKVGTGGNIWHPGATVALRDGATYNLATLSAPIEVSCNVEAQGATLVTANGYAQSVLIVGHDTTGNVLHDADIKLPNLTGTAPTAHAVGSVGVTVRNLTHSRLWFGRVIFYETAHRYTGKGIGTAYNTIHPGWIDLCKVAMRFDSGADGLGWANQNTFLGGGVTQSPVWAAVRREAGWRHIVMDGNPGWTVHGNTFVGCSYEGNISEIYFDLRNASDNQWIGATRFEQGDLGRPVLMGADLLATPDAGIYINNHGLVVGDMVCFNANNYPPNMTAGVPYRVETVASDSFSVTAYPSGSTIVFGVGGVDVRVLRPPLITLDNTDQNTYGNKIHEGYNSWPGPLELIRTGPTGPTAKAGLDF